MLPWLNSAAFGTLVFILYSKVNYLGNHNLLFSTIPRFL